jgi:hypothetical protein
MRPGPVRRLFASGAAVAGIPLSALWPALVPWGLAAAGSAGEADVLLGETPGPPELPRVRVQRSWCAGALRVTEEAEAGAPCSRLERLVRCWGPSLDAPTIHAAAAALPDGSDAATLAARLASGAPTGPRDAVRRWLAVDALMNAVPPDPARLAELISDAARHAATRPSRVSIVINNRNYVSYLGAAIASALDQTRPAHEVVVVDDGSTDGSRDVIARVPQVRTVLKENGGQASALNAGFAVTTGDLVLFLDADDRLLPDAVATLSEQRIHGVARLSFALETIDASDHPTGLFPMSRQAASGALRGPLLERGFLMMMPTSGNAFPRATLERLMPIPEAAWRISADVYLAFGAAFLGEARHLDRVLGQYRLHGRNAHFATMGAEAPHAARKVGQRRQAFADLAARLRAIDPARHARDAARLTALAAPRSPAARIGALHARLSGPRRPLARPPLSAGGGRDRPPPGRLRRHLLQADPAAFGGAATWPLLAPGEVVAMESGRGRALLGPGWRRVPERGVRPVAPFAALALRLPGPRADWTLRLGIEDGGPLGLWINGMRHDPLPEGGTTLTLRIAGDVLERDGQSGAWRAGITLVPEGPTPVITHLAAQRALPAFGAPLLPLGRSLRPGDPAGRRCLAEGWHWPDAAGARMAGPEAVLRLSVAGTGDHWLHLEMSPLPLLAASDGAALDQEADAQGRGLLLHLPAASIPSSGKLEVTLTAAEGGPRPVLTALRLLPAEDGRRPGRWVAPADLGAAGTGDGTLRVPLPRGAGLLLLRFEGAPEGGGTADVTLVSAGARAVLRIAGPADALIAPGAGADRLNLVLPPGLELAGLARHPDRPRAVTPSEPLDHLDPAALAARAEHDAAWQAAEGEALWLVADAGRLRLARPDPGGLRVTARLLTLPGTGQRLTLEIGGARATGGGEIGPETLTLDVPASPDPVLTLALSTSLLVDARLAGIEAGGLLGGALLDLAIAPVGEAAT